MNIPECQKTADVCKALGDYQRVMIVRSLMEGEKTTDELVELLCMCKSTLVHHLRVLERAAIPSPFYRSAEVRDRYKFYSVGPDTLSMIWRLPSMITGETRRRS